MEWTGDVESTDNPLELTMESDKEITAVFETVSYPLNIDVSGEGEVSRFPDQEEYEYGTQVQLTASAEDGWSFIEWEGDENDDSNPLVITIEEETSLTAVFAIYTSGSGTSADPYEVSTLVQLQAMGKEEFLDRHFVQVNDIDASDTNHWNDGAGFEPIGESSFSDRFTGSFDGGDFVISDLTIDRPDESDVGLFGYARGGSIRNVGLVDAEITGDSHVGSVAGRNFGELRESFATGHITGDRVVGGLVGYNAGEIFDSYAIATVEASTSGIGHAGGLVGETRQLTAGASPPPASISRSYAASTVSGGGDVGGFIARHDDDDVVELEENYWDNDLETTGIGSFRSGAGAYGTNELEGLPTGDMQGNSAEDNMDGFDFGTIWQTVTSDYPILQWQ